MKFKEFDNINDIEIYTKCDLLVTRDNAVKCEPGEYFICDLIGLTVVTDEGNTLGKLTDVIETGANNVYESQPLVAEYITFRLLMNVYLHMILTIKQLQYMC